MGEKKEKKYKRVIFQFFGFLGSKRIGKIGGVLYKKKLT